MPIFNPRASPHGFLLVQRVVEFDNKHIGGYGFENRAFHRVKEMHGVRSDKVNRKLPVNNNHPHQRKIMSRVRVYRKGRVRCDEIGFALSKTELAFEGSC